MSTVTGSQTSSPDGSPTTTPQLGQTYVQSSITITVIIVDIIITMVVLLRLITRKFIVKSLGWDDWTIAVAAIGNNIGFALVLVELHYGFGRHRSELTPYSYMQFSRFVYGEWIQTFQTLMLTKISICLLLLRIVISRTFVYSLWAMIAMLISSNLILTLLWILQCRPVWLAWESPMEPGACFNMMQLRDLIFAQAIVSIFSDFVLAAYPIFIIRRLKMPMKTKVGLCLLMGLGVITGSFCTVRTVLNWQNVTEDVTWDSIPNWYWRSWEICVGITVACIPALRPGYKSMTGHWREYTTRGSSGKTSFSRATRDTSGPSQVSRPSETSQPLTHPQYVPPPLRSEKHESQPPTLPEIAVRPDLGRVRAMVGNENSKDSLRLPIQTMSGVFVPKEDLKDIESQQTLRDELLDDESHDPKLAGWESQDSETALRRPS